MHFNVEITLFHTIKYDLLLKSYVQFVYNTLQLQPIHSSLLLKQFVATNSAISEAMTRFAVNDSSLLTLTHD